MYPPRLRSLSCQQAERWLMYLQGQRPPRCHWARRSSPSRGPPPRKPPPRDLRSPPATAHSQPCPDLPQIRPRTRSRRSAGSNPTIAVGPSIPVQRVAALRAPSSGPRSSPLIVSRQVAADAASRESRQGGSVRSLRCSASERRRNRIPGRGRVHQRAAPVRRRIRPAGIGASRRHVVAASLVRTATAGTGRDPAG